MGQSLFWEGAIFTTLAIGGIGLMAWWLFVSPVAEQVENALSVSAATSRTFGLLIALGVFLFSVGGYWDASEHVVTGIVPGGEDFLWPPHLMLYAGFLLSFAVAVAGLVALAKPNIAAGIRDPRLWVRRNPYVGATVLAAGYGLLSVPGDAIWHEIYGIDLTAWSPPHIFLVMASATTVICAIGLLLQSRGQVKNRGGFSLFILLLLAVMLNEAYLIGVLEWEIRTVTGFILERPSWLYPVILGGLAFFVISLGRRLVPGPWTATTVALFFFAWRILGSAFAQVVSGAPPRLTLVFVLGAVLLDLTAQRSHRKRVHQVLIEAAAFTAGFVVIALPTIQFIYLPYLTRFTALDHLLTVLITFAVCALLQPAAQTVGAWLVGERTPKVQIQEMAPAMGD
ncbi:MAG: hypothetical protein KF753_17510 [Caldilineaceae bacterium]|nr:hypothetical protein [Caldilineaceae bacterium]